MSELLASAFAGLGMGPSWDELAMVAAMLRRSGDEDAIAALDVDLGGDEFTALVGLAATSGASGFVALDLVTAFGNPGESPVRGGERP